MSNQFGETVVNENGGKQSRLNTRFDLIPPETLRKVAEVLCYGAEHYGVNNWYLTTFEENINHCLDHINAYQLGLDTGEPHLSHALVRLIFAEFLASKSPEELEKLRSEYKSSLEPINTENSPEIEKQREPIMVDFSNLNLQLQDVFSLGEK